MHTADTVSQRVYLIHQQKKLNSVRVYPQYVYGVYSDPPRTIEKETFVLFLALIYEFETKRPGKRRWHHAHIAFEVPLRVSEIKQVFLIIFSGYTPG